MPAMSEHFTVVGRPHGLVERHSTALQPTSSAGVLPRPTPTPAAETTTAKPNRCQADAEQLRALRDRGPGVGTAQIHPSRVPQLKAAPR